MTQPEASGINVQINEFGSNTAGEFYGLNCSVFSEELNDDIVTSFRWSKNVGCEMRNIINSSTTTISDNTSYSLLSFPSLYQSHAGIYTCTIEVDSSDERSSNFEINVIGMYDCNYYYCLK